MKLFRFIKNLWAAVLNSLGDGDLKSLFRHVASYIAFLVAFFGAIYGLGFVGNAAGLSQLLPPDKRDDMFGLGAMMFVCIIVILFTLLSVYIIFTKLKEIWRKS